MRSSAPFSSGNAEKAKAQDVTPVTQPFLPPLREFQPYLEQIWANRWLTNCGPFHQQFEAALENYLGVQHVALTSNGTMALLLALQALDLDGEVITTPFSFVATTHALRLSNLRPVFVDIDPVTGNLDPAQIEQAISPRTSAIMPVHCFGHPCDVEQIDRIADTFGVKVIYDAAHAFGVQYKGRSILTHGDASTLSFHATKVFNTFEGGAVVCSTDRIKHRIERLRNFGFAGEVTVVAPGTNGKMNEFQAAFGLLQLDHIDHVIARRATISIRYRAELTGVPGIGLFGTRSDWISNHSYFPILVQDGHINGRDALCERLHAEGIMARRYFYPLICDTPVYRDLPSARSELPVARRIAREVLCLPLHPHLTDAQVDRAIRIVRGG